MYTIRNILVTTDFSEYSATALEYAQALAGKMNANIHLLHVFAEHRHGSFPTVLRPQDEASAEAEMNKFIDEHVDEYTYVKHAVRCGIPAKEILRYANENDVGLIVIATHGRTGLAHVLLGSVAEKVVRLSGIPVMTVKPAEFLKPLITDDDVAAELHLGEKEQEQ
jgi:nucleotide-binding universal stress UspA family protein